MHEFDLDPDEVRRLAHRAADMVADHVAGLRDGPVFGKLGEAASVFDEPLPQDGRSADAVLDAARDDVLSHPFGNSHPRFWAFINATPDPMGIIADFLASAMNSNCWGGDHASIHVEDRVVRWIAEILGLPPESEGILTSGGSMANFTALATARRAMAPAVREDGTAGGPPLVVYASEEAHNCVDKAVDLLGLGTRQLRAIPTDDRFRVRVDALREAIAEDRRAGLRPAIVVGNAGSVNTGAIDPLEEMADLCAGEDLWFHVDGAYGAMACVSETLRPLFAGLERADSVATDPHKWLYVPFEAGATLVREPGRLADAFRRPASYLVHDPDSPVRGPVLFNERGPELSRGFKALKVWMGLRRHGRTGYAAAVEHDVAMARFLADQVRAHEDLELLAEPGLSIVNFRYRPRGRAMAEPDLDRLNRRIVNRLVESGAFFLAPTLVRGRTSLRVAIVNFRTREDDLLALVDETTRAGRAPRLSSPKSANRIRFPRHLASNPALPAGISSVGRGAMGDAVAVATLGDRLIPTPVDDDRRAAEWRRVQAAQSGDLVAFEHLYRDNERRVFALCMRLSADPALAEELTQEVFIRAWRKLGSFRGQSAFSSWLYPLTVNVALTERRSRRRRLARIVPTEDGAAPEAPAPERAPDAGFDLEAAMATLPRGARRVFVLHDVEGRTHEEIANLLGLATGTSKAQLHRARRLLREALRS